MVSFSMRRVVRPIWPGGGFLLGVGSEVGAADHALLGDGADGEPGGAGLGGFWEVVDGDDAAAGHGGDGADAAHGGGDFVAVVLVDVEEPEDLAEGVDVDDVVAAGGDLGDGVE